MVDAARAKARQKQLQHQGAALLKKFNLLQSSMHFGMFNRLGATVML